MRPLRTNLPRASRRSGRRRRGLKAPVRFRLILVPLAGDPPPLVRLRSALKALLRAYRLRCETVEQLPGRPAAAAEGR